MTRLKFTIYGAFFALGVLVGSLWVFVAARPQQTVPVSFGQTVVFSLTGPASVDLYPQRVTLHPGSAGIKVNVLGSPASVSTGS